MHQIYRQSKNWRKHPSTKGVFSCENLHRYRIIFYVCLKGWDFACEDVFVYARLPSCLISAMKIERQTVGDQWVETYFREHLQINIGNLVSDVNIGMFRFRSLLHVTLSIISVWKFGNSDQIGSQSDNSNRNIEWWAEYFNTRRYLHSELSCSRFARVVACSAKIKKNDYQRLWTDYFVVIYLHFNIYKIVWLFCIVLKQETFIILINNSLLNLLSVCKLQCINSNELTVGALVVQVYHSDVIFECRPPLH